MGNLVSKMTPRRMANSVRILTSYYRSRAKGQALHRGMPVSISIEPTTSCNLRCPECPSGLRSFTRPTGMLSQGLYKQVIEELHPTLLYLILYFQGEPYLHPDFYDFISFAHKKNIYTSTSTNAHYLDMDNARKTVESGLDRLIISMDGTSQESYESYRKGGSLAKVIDGMDQLISWKKKLKSKTPHTILQFIVFRQNEHEIPEVREIARKTGVDELAIKTAQIYDFENGSDLLPSADEYSRYAKNGTGEWKIKNRLLDHCWKMWHSSVITWDGKIVPCCFDKDASHVIGELNGKSFREIWHSQDYDAFRQQLLNSRSTIDICKNCTEGTKVFS